MGVIVLFRHIDGLGDVDNVGVVVLADVLLRSVCEPDLDKHVVRIIVTVFGVYRMRRPSSEHTKTRGNDGRH